MQLSVRDRVLIERYKEYVAGAYGQDFAELLAEAPESFGPFSFLQKDEAERLKRLSYLRGQLSLLRELDRNGLLAELRSNTQPHPPCPVCDCTELRELAQSPKGELAQLWVECKGCFTSAPAVAWDKRSDKPFDIQIEDVLNKAAAMLNALAHRISTPGIRNVTDAMVAEIDNVLPNGLAGDPNILDDAQQDAV